ncbi:MAG: glutathione S-transferase family protein [Janthinobacterium lividum]
MDLRLFIAPGSCSRVSTIALEEVGVAFETETVALKLGQHKSPSYLALNPVGKVPLLLIDGKPLAQTVAILTWLARSFPAAALLPDSDAYVEAVALSRLTWCSSDLHQLVTRMRIPAMSCDLPGSAERTRAQAAAAMATQLAPIEASLAVAPWLQGTAWSVLDAYIFWVWYRIVGAGFPTDRFPFLGDQARRMALRPAVARALARETAAQIELDTAGGGVVYPPVLRIVLPE